MKLALIALAIEVSLARIFVGSWGWAVAIVLLYCTFVYVRQTLLIKKQNKNKSLLESEHIVIQGCINSNRKSQQQLYDRYPCTEDMQKN